MKKKKEKNPIKIILERFFFKKQEKEKMRRNVDEIPAGNKMQRKDSGSFCVL